MKHPTATNREWTEYRKREASYTVPPPPMHLPQRVRGKARQLQKQRVQARVEALEKERDEGSRGLTFAERRQLHEMQHGLARNRVAEKNQRRRANKRTRRAVHTALPGVVEVSSSSEADEPAWAEDDELDWT